MKNLIEALKALLKVFEHLLKPLEETDKARKPIHMLFSTLKHPEGSLFGPMLDIVS